jgi:hypothetical protein
MLVVCKRITIKNAPRDRDESASRALFVIVRGLGPFMLLGGALVVAHSSINIISEKNKKKERKLTGQRVSSLHLPLAARHRGRSGLLAMAGPIGARGKSKEGGGREWPREILQQNQH